jgi:sarcosine oxidase subunit gamma
MPDMMQPDVVSQAFELRTLPRMARFILRGDAEAARNAGAAFGVEIPGVAMVAAREGPRAALWLGPDEWLLLAPASEEEFLAQSLEAALAAAPHALVNVGHREVVAEISGHRVTDVLNAGCPLDLDLSAFPVGMCTRTVLAKAQIVLWRTGARVFQLHVWRSFFPYVGKFLIEARTRL